MSSTILPLSSNKPGATSFSISTFFNRLYKNLLKKKIVPVSTSPNSPIPKKNLTKNILFVIIILSFVYFISNTILFSSRKTNIRSNEPTVIYDEFGNAKIIKNPAEEKQKQNDYRVKQIELDEKKLKLQIEQLKTENEKLKMENLKLKQKPSSNNIENNNQEQQDLLKEMKQKQNKELEEILNENNNNNNNNNENINNERDDEERQKIQEKNEELEKQEQELEKLREEILKEENLLREKQNSQSFTEDLNNADVEKKNAVISAFLHAWKGYVTYAWGQDELDPVAKRSKNWAPGGIGMTILDSLDTMYLMGLTQELADSRQWINDHLTFDKNVDISLFETTIRVLGGLLSAYGFTNDEIYKTKAVEIADRLIWAFNTSSGLPYTTVNLQTHHCSNPNWNGGRAVLAEFATLQLEFRYLSHITGNPVYDQKVTKAMDVLEAANTNDGLYPIFFSEHSGSPAGGRITFGAMGDSAYEYLIKQYLLTSKTEQRYKKMYDRSMNGMINKLVKTSPSGLVFVAEAEGGSTINKFDHLACFVAGMLAIGAEGEKKEQHMKLAEDIGYTCYQMYNKQPSGLAPELVHFNPDMTAGHPAYYILRPETVESLFYLWRFTKDQKYRDWGWEIFQAIEKHCKVASGGYAGVRSVTTPFTEKDDTQQSFFLAETLKYLYLLFAEDKALDLNKYVFNTEAHPLPVFFPRNGDNANNDRDDKPNFE